MMNNNNNTMNNNNNNAMNNNDNNTATPATMRTPAQKPQAGTPSALYKLAARNLREYHGVPSMTALKLEKTVALLGLAPRRFVVRGLAPRRLLLKAGEGSGYGEEKLGETKTGDLMDASDENNSSSSSEQGSEEEKEEVGHEKGVLNCSDSLIDDINSNSNYNGGVPAYDVALQADGSGKARRPIHDALVAGGINLRPHEARPLLRALGVKPHRLVRLGLVKREAIRGMPRGRGGDPGQRQRLGAGGPRKGGMGRPHGPPRGPSRGLGGRLMHGPPLHFHGDGHHTMHLREEGEEGGHDHGSPDGCKPGHGHRHPPHGHGHGHGHGRGHGHGPGHGRGHGLGNRGSEGEEGKRAHEGAPRPEQHCPRRLGGGMGRSHGPPHGPPREPFLGRGASGAPHRMMAHRRHGSPSRGGGGMKQRGGRHGGTGFCGGGGGGGGHRQHGRMAHLAHSDGRHQPQLEAC